MTARIRSGRVNFYFFITNYLVRMYTVTICPDCQYVWIIEDVPDRTQCKRCRTSHQFKNLRNLKQTEDMEEARRYRAACQAQAEGRDDDFARAVEEENILDRDVDIEVDFSNRFEREGVDPEEVNKAGDVSSQKSKSELEIVQEAVNTIENPTLEEITEYSGERDVGAEKVEKVVEKMRQRGELIRSGNGYKKI